MFACQLSENSIRIIEEVGYANVATENERLVEPCCEQSESDLWKWSPEFFDEMWIKGHWELTEKGRDLEKQYRDNRYVPNYWVIIYTGSYLTVFKDANVLRSYLEHNKGVYAIVRGPHGERYNIKMSLTLVRDPDSVTIDPYLDVLEQQNPETD